MGEELLSCRQYEKLIPMYLNKTLSDEETIALIDHVKKCPSCREELTIQHMVAVGLNNLDEIIDLNVDSELDKRRRQMVLSLYKKDVTERMHLGVFFVGLSTFFLALLLIIL